MSRCIAPRTPPHSHHLGRRLLMGMEDNIDDAIIDSESHPYEEVISVTIGINATFSWASSCHDLMGRTELEDDDDDD